MQKEFFELLEERNKEGATIFLSSHVLSEIQSYCHRAAIIRDGRIIACDMVSALGNTSARRVTLRGVCQVPSLPGIMDVHCEKGSVSFLYQGNPKTLLSVLNTMDITDLTITEPSLEEIFLHYYSEGGIQ
jgi:ABC-2 type transport system ATP-binding protein